jgi:hypothetical protein
MTKKYFDLFLLFKHINHNKIKTINIVFTNQTSIIDKYICRCNAAIVKLRAQKALITDTLPNHSFVQVKFFED